MILLPNNSYVYSCCSFSYKKQIVQEFQTSKLQPHYLGKYTKILTKEKKLIAESKKKNEYEDQDIIMAP